MASPRHAISLIFVDRFYGLFHEYKKKVSLPGLIVVATAKYLIGFYDIPRDRLHIITLDIGLWEGSKKVQNCPVPTTQRWLAIVGIVYSRTSNSV